MSSKYFYVDYASGSNIYIRFWNDAHEVHDFNDGTFKAIASATTPQILCTWDADQDIYRTNSTVDLADLNNTGTPTTILYAGYDNAVPASSDAPVTDYSEIQVQWGELDYQDTICCFDGAFTSTAGTTFRAFAWLERGGQKVTLATATCSIVIREHGAGGDLFTFTDAAPNAAGIFELEQASPGFTSDRIYTAHVSITENSKTWTTTHTLPVFG